MTDQTSPASPAGPVDLPAAALPALDPPRDRIFVSFLALALTSFCLPRLLASWGVNPFLTAGLFTLPYFFIVLFLAQADQNQARANRSNLDKLAVFLLMLIYLLNAVPYWFAAREVARRPAVRRALWISALLLVGLFGLFIVDWQLLRPAA